MFAASAKFLNDFTRLYEETYFFRFFNYCVLGRITLANIKLGFRLPLLNILLTDLCPEEVWKKNNLRE